MTLPERPLDQRPDDRALVHALVGEEILVLGREDRADEQRWDVGGAPDQNAAFGRGDAGDGPLVFADEHGLLGEIGRVLSRAMVRRVDAQVVVDLAGVVRVDELDDRLELDVSDDRQHDEHANRDETAPHQPAHEPHEGPGQIQQRELQLATRGTLHRFPST